MRRIAWLAALAVALLSLTTRGDEGPRDNRSSVKIMIVAKVKPSSWPGIIRTKLKGERFTVDSSSEDVEAEEWFKRQKDLNHVVDVYTKRVFVHTRTKAGVSRQEIQDENVDRMEKKISRYLTSPATIELRMQLLPEQSPFSKGYRLAAEGKFEQAVIEFRKEAKVSPNNPDVFYNLGVCYRRLDNASEGEKAVKAGLALDPQHTGLRNLQALLLWTSDDKVDKAIEILADLGDEPVYQWNLALAYARKGDLKKAQEYYEKIANNQVDAAWSLVGKEESANLQKKIAEQQAEIDKQKESLKAKQETISEREAVIGSQSAGLAMVGWISGGVVLVLIGIFGYYFYARNLAGMINTASTSDKMTLLVALVSGVVSIVGAVISAVIGAVFKS